MQLLVNEQYVNGQIHAPTAPASAFMARTGTYLSSTLHDLVCHLKGIAWTVGYRWKLHYEFYNSYISQSKLLART